MNLKIHSRSCSTEALVRFCSIIQPCRPSLLTFQRVQLFVCTTVSFCLYVNLQIHSRSCSTEALARLYTIYIISFFLSRAVFKHHWVLLSLCEAKLHSRPCSTKSNNLISHRVYVLSTFISWALGPKVHYECDFRDYILVIAQE